MLARNGDFDIGQLVPQDMHSLPKPVHFLSGQEPKRKGLFCGPCGSPRRLRSRINLSHRQARMVEEGPTRRG